MTTSQTIPQQFLSLVKKFPHKDALSQREGDRWVSLSFSEWEKRSRAVAAALMEDGVARQDSVSVFSFSRREWLEADMGILLCGARTATIYQNLGSETVTHILNDASVKVVFAEGPIQLRAIFGEQHHKVLPPTLKRIVYFQNSQTPAHREGKPAPQSLSLSEVIPDKYRHVVVSYEDYVQRGQRYLGEHQWELESRIQSVADSDIAKVVYTSGTSGVPKGALLSHRNLTSVTEHLHETLELTAEDKTLLFLPLAHVYAQLVYHAQMRIGFTIGFARSMLTAVDDAQSFRPDFFVSVPRLFEKIHGAVLADVEQGGVVKQKVFQWAMDVGLRVSKKMQLKQPLGTGLAVQASVANRLVFSKLQNRLGGKVRLMISGGAPLQTELVEFFHAAGLLIIEGYGMTENASLSHHNRVHHFRFGTVGLPVANTEVRLAEDGEILIRSAGVMTGYLNLPAETSEALDSDGWLHTGDIGAVNEEGFLKITDRKKDIIVTSGGKNIAPAPIEAALSRLTYISQAMVFGNKRKFLTALLTLDPETARKWGRENGVGEDLEVLCRNEKLYRLVETQVIALNRTFEQFETVKKFALLPREFSIDAGEMTPSLKLRKKIIEEHYSQVVDDLYTG